jgi:RNA polymerase sigma factor (sigma-70 family)
MPAVRENKFLYRFRGVLACQEVFDLSDADLLRLYVRERDEIAFATLVRRHGPMVLGVCRRILRNVQDIEDAFQATFLVLVRRASSIQRPGTLANWLHGVARRTALEARGASARRRVVEMSVAPRTEMHDGPDEELWPILEQELGRLREQYRAVVILCDLEGKTRKEVAHQLGWAEGTVASRLARGRNLLAKRLNRRGFSSTLVAAALSATASKASVPTDLVTATLAVASLSNLEKKLSGVLLSPNVVSLTEGVLKSMFPIKIKIVMAALVMLGITTLGMGALVTRTEATEPATGIADMQEPGRAKADNLQERVLEMKRQLAEMQRKLELLEQETQTGQKVRKASNSAEASLFKHKVAFEMGFTEFTEGGNLEIREVWGTRSKIEVGGQYLVRGKYVLPRGVRGKLYFYETSSGDWDNSKTATLDLQMAAADKREGEFTLVHGMLGEGSFHIVLADEERYSRMFANVYFGTGDNVWRKKP